MTQKFSRIAFPAFHTFKSIRFSHAQVQNESCNVKNAFIEKTILKVAIVGAPNAGKSTLINNLMDRRVCPTSAKVHTTRTKANAIFTDGHAQIVFVDTPGLVNEREQKRHHLEKSFVRDPMDGIKNSDLIGVIHDVGNRWTQDRLDIKVINLLEKQISIPSFLILNKIDMLKSKRKLLDITRLITENNIDGKPMKSNKYYKSMDNPRGWPYFKEVFMVSALTNNGLEGLKNFLIEKAHAGEWLYPEEQWSDQSLENLVVTTVQAKLLDFLPQEIPYQLRSELEFCEISSAGVLQTVVLVHCPTTRISKLVAGAGDGKLKQIIGEVQRDLQSTFNKPVHIRIVLQTPKKE